MTKRQKQRSIWNKTYRRKHPKRAKRFSDTWRFANLDYPVEYYARKKKRIKKLRKLRCQQNKAFLTWIKEALPCADCSRNFPPECMDFDHVRGRKKINLGAVGANIYSRDRVLKELMKCEVVCACCHRTRTKRQLKWK